MANDGRPKVESLTELKDQLESSADPRSYLRIGRLDFTKADYEWYADYGADKIAKLTVWVDGTAYSFDEIVTIIREFNALH